MAESSSDSDSFRRHRVGSRGPLRATHIRARNHGTEEVTEKIHTLASTLQVIRKWLSDLQIDYFACPNKMP